jgi:ATP-binding cassette subfamily F protein uup
VRDLSGGEKRRVALCRALVCQPDFLILDEPTNHLDTEAIEWLQKFLAGYPGTCLFVTHDRYFLDQVATGIAELAAGTCLRYEWSYTDYLVARAERRTVAEQQERKRQKFLDRELAWIRRGPSARRTKSVDRIDRYFELAQQQGPEAESEVELILPPAPKLSDRVVEMRGLGLKLNERWLFQQVNFELRPRERVGIIGRNGLGKSSLLKIILGELTPTVGEVQLGPQTKINHVDQNRLIISEEKTVSEEVGGGSEIVRLGDQSISLRAYLRRFLFPEAQASLYQLRIGGNACRKRPVASGTLHLGTQP